MGKAAKVISKRVIDRIYKNLTRTDGWAASGNKKRVINLLKKAAEDLAK